MNGTKFQAAFRCAADHEQVITYGPGFSREQVDTMVALLVGGEIASLGKTVPGTNPDCGICGGKLTAEVIELHGEG